jgi:CheY-like chemotaxis protein
MTINSPCLHSPIATPRPAAPRSGPLTHSMLASASREDAQGRKALIVDDNLQLLEVAAELFRLLGYEVLTAENGAQADEILRRTPDIDVLFSDIVMPGMNGMELGYEARKLIPNINIILVSGYASPALTVGRGDLQDFKFLRKPYGLSEIIRLLAKPT